MKILITGINGFVGSNLVTAYKIHHTIYGLDIVSPLKEGVVNTYAWNDLDKLPEVDIIIHLAGKAHDTKNTSSPQSYFDINLGLTQKIFDYYLQSKTSKFILFSSVKAVADTVVGEFLTEEVIPDPKTPYGHSKLAAEQYITESYAAWTIANSPTPDIYRGPTNHQPPSTNHQKSPQPLSPNPQQNQQPKANSQQPKAFHILRPCMIHGPGNKGNLNLLYKLVQKGIPWPLGKFDNKRSFCSIDNLIFVIQKLIEKDLNTGIYQVADDLPLSTNELVSLIAESLNKKALILNLNQNLIRFLASSGGLLHLPLNTERLKKLTESYVVSNQKLKTALGIDNMPVSSMDGMRKTLKSFRDKTT